MPLESANDPLLWDLDESEYKSVVEPPQPAPSKSHGRLEFWSGDKKLETMIWSKPSEKDSKTATLWIEKEEASPEVVTVEASVIQKLEKDLDSIFA